MTQETRTTITLDADLLKSTVSLFNSGLVFLSDVENIVYCGLEVDSGFEIDETYIPVFSKMNKLTTTAYRNFEDTRDDFGKYAHLLDAVHQNFLLKSFHTVMNMPPDGVALEMTPKVAAEILVKSDKLLKMIETMHKNLAGYIAAAFITHRKAATALRDALRELPAGTIRIEPEQAMEYQQSVCSATEDFKRYTRANWLLSPRLEQAIIDINRSYMVEKQLRRFLDVFEPQVQIPHP